MNEKKMILEMLQDGKITSEEALGLLEKLKEIDNSENSQENSNYNDDIVGNGNYHHHEHDGGDHRHHHGHNPHRMHGMGMHGFHNPRGFRRGRRHDMDFNWLDELRDSVESAAKNVMESFEGMDSTFNMNGPKYDFELRAPIDNDGIKSLMLPAINSKMDVTGYDGDEIIITGKYSMKFLGEPPMELKSEGGNYSLLYDKGSFSSVGFKAMVPRMFEIDEVTLLNKNGKIDVERLNAKTIKSETTNAPVNFDEITTNSIHAITKNSSLSFDKVITETIYAQTSNAKIKVDDTKAKEVRLETTNAGITVEDSGIHSIYAKTTNAKVSIKDFPKSENQGLYNIMCETTNGTIMVEKPDKNIPFYVLAATSLGRIEGNLDGIKFDRYQKNFIEGKSDGFDEAVNKLELRLRTSHGAIIIE